MKNIFLASIFIVFSIVTFGQTTRDTLQTKIGFSVKIHSKHLNDSVKLYVHHPFSFQKEKEFPLVVLLDGNSSFKAFAGPTELMAYDGSIPACIVVGFPQYKYAQFDSVNLEDKMEKLSMFFEEEMLPRFRSQYNITKTIVWGQGSESGLISSYLMLRFPDVFDGYISDIPDLRLMGSKVYSENIFDKHNGADLNYYLFGNSTFDIYNERFLNNIKSNAPEGLHLNYQTSDEPNVIIYFLTNYLHALEMFFNDGN